jgi:peroxiredoxin
MTPHLVKWHNEQAGTGLAVIEIDNGERDSLEELKAHIQEAGIAFPVLHDEQGQLCDRFGVQAYPTAYLIGRDGNVLWQGHPGNVADHERLIAQALAD